MYNTRYNTYMNIENTPGGMVQVQVTSDARRKAKEMAARIDIDQRTLISELILREYTRLSVEPRGFSETASGASMTSEPKAEYSVR